MDINQQLKHMLIIMIVAVDQHPHPQKQKHQHVIEKEQQVNTILDIIKMIIDMNIFQTKNLIVLLQQRNNLIATKIRLQASMYGVNMQAIQIIF
jgi:hypothetical protein